MFIAFIFAALLIASMAFIAWACQSDATSTTTGWTARTTDFIINN